MARRAAKIEKQASGWPGAEVLALDLIRPYPKNPRTHPAAQIALLASLFKRHGVDQPIVVDEEGVILKGHGRRLAAIEAGFKDFPVVTKHGLPEQEKRAIRLQDNQSALLSGWEPVLLRQEMTQLKLDGYDMPLLGFGEAELIALTMPAISDPLSEWRNMPEYQQSDNRPFRTILVHFNTQADVDAFAEKIAREIGDQTKTLWWPDAPVREPLHNKTF